MTLTAHGPTLEGTSSGCCKHCRFSAESKHLINKNNDKKHSMVVEKKTEKNRKTKIASKLIFGQMTDSEKNAKIVDTGFY